MDHWVTILLKSDIKEVKNILSTCKLFNNFNNWIWKLLIKRDFDKIGYTEKEYKKYKNIEYFWNLIESCKDREILNLPYKKIKEIPPDWNPNCQTLDLSDNQITEIPPDWNPNCRIII